MITHISFDGAEAVKASNGRLEMILIPGFGSQVISLVDTQTGQELLVKPETFRELQEMPYLKGIPVLFPPNRVAGGTFTFEGVTHQFPINEAGGNHMHGFVYDKSWNLITEKEQENLVILETEIKLDSPAIYKDASIRMTYELDGPVLRQKATVKNNGNEAFPWGIGYHTTFLFDESVSTFSLTAEKQWTLTEQALPTGELTPVVPFKEASLQGKQLDDAFLASKTGNKAAIYNKKTGQNLVYRTDSSFTQWVIYNGSGEEGFVCPEPYTSITNAFNLRMPAELTGLQILQPGEEKIVRTEIEVG